MSINRSVRQTIELMHEQGACPTSIALQLGVSILQVEKTIDRLDRLPHNLPGITTPDIGATGGHQPHRPDKVMVSAERNERAYTNRWANEDIIGKPRSRGTELHRTWDHGYNPA